MRILPNKKLFVISALFTYACCAAVFAGLVMVNHLSSQKTADIRLASSMIQENKHLAVQNLELHCSWLKETERSLGSDEKFDSEYMRVATALKEQCSN